MNISTLPRWLSWTLALCAGLILPFSFAPTEIWLLAPLSLGALYWLVQNLTARQGFWIGWVFGLGYFGIGVHWIYYSLHLFGAAIAPLAVLLTLVFVLVMTVFPATTVMLWIRFKVPGAKWLNAFLFAAIWVLAELLRGKLMGGFPWILVGYSQTTGPMGHLAPLMGVYGIGFLIVLFSALAASVVLHKTQRIHCGVLVVAMLIAAFAVKNVSYSAPDGEPLNVRLVQANIPQEMKFSRERLQSALTLYTTMTREEGLADIDLVVWPETAIPTYFDRVEDVMAPFANSMDAAGIDVLTGGFHRDGDDVYNAVRQLGGERVVYRKRHLVPFGEFMPLRFLLDFAARFIEIPMSDLSAGAGPHVPLDMQGTRIGISICYEDVYGEEMRALLPAATLLVNVSNDAWFGDSSAPHQHEQKARMRAREFARPLVRVTNTGVSSAIDYQGNILGRIAHNTKGIFDVSVQPRQGLTPYARTGNWPVFILAVLVCLGILVRRKV